MKLESAAVAVMLLKVTVCSSKFMSEAIFVNSLLNPSRRTEALFVFILPEAVNSVSFLPVKNIVKSAVPFACLMSLRFSFAFERRGLLLIR